MWLSAIHVIFTLNAYCVYPCMRIRIKSRCYIPHGHVYPWFLYMFVSLCIYSVLWEPMGDGKRLISLADNHALLWDLQESSTQATVIHTHTHAQCISQKLTHYLITTVSFLWYRTHTSSLCDNNVHYSSWCTHKHPYKPLSLLLRSILIVIILCCTRNNQPTPRARLVTILSVNFLVI